MNTSINIKDITALSIGNGDAGGVAKKHWFVAVTRKNNTEKSSAKRLQELGYECYVATQEEYKIFSCGKKGRINCVVIPSVVFVYCSEAERLQILKMPFISRFMTDKAGAINNLGRKPAATVPDAQIRRLQFMLGESNSPVSFVNRFVRGQKVRVIRGKLTGLEGVIINDTDGKSKLCIEVELCGNACLDIEPINVEPVK